jgi:hypothetical protein
MGGVTLRCMPGQRFDIRLGRRSLALLRLWGVRPGRAYAEIGGDDPDALFVRFGRVTFRTSLRNIARWRIEGPWRWITAIGLRRSIRHGDVSFAGSPHGGVRLDFRERVAWFVFHVPAVYVGANDLEAFAAALADRGIPGEDARTRKVP